MKTIIIKVNFLLSIILAAIFIFYDLIIGVCIFVGSLVLLYVSLQLDFAKKKLPKKIVKKKELIVKKKPKLSFLSSLKSYLSFFKRRSERGVDRKIVDLIKNRVGRSKRTYETHLDRVLDLVRRYKRLRLCDVAKGFDVSKEKIEEWGGLLEERHLLKLYYPTIGEPELREIGFVVKKKQPAEKHKKNKMVIGVIVILVVVMGIFFGFRDKHELTPIKPIEIDITTAAFSGSGSYECDLKKEDLSVHYWIRDKKMRTATLMTGQTTISIFKEGNMYTYLATKGKWIKTNLTEDSVVPGSGHIPKEAIICKKSSIDDVKFEIPEAKIEVIK